MLTKPNEIEILVDPFVKTASALLGPGGAMPGEVHAVTAVQNDHYLAMATQDQRPNLYCQALVPPPSHCFIVACAYIAPSHADSSRNACMCERTRLATVAHIAKNLSVHLQRTL